MNDDQSELEAELAARVFIDCTYARPAIRTQSASDSVATLTKLLSIAASLRFAFFFALFF